MVNSHRFSPRMCGKQRVQPSGCIFEMDSAQAPCGYIYGETGLNSQNRMNAYCTIEINPGPLNRQNQLFLR
jgi:hypothetical protein